VSGWYPDPQIPATSRWWDGQAWTPHTQLAFAPLPPDPQRDLADELKAGRLAAIGLRLGAALNVVEFLVIALVVKRFVDSIRIAADQVQQDPNSTVNPFAGVGHGYFVLLGLFYLLGFLALAALVLLMIWASRAATFAQRAGLPARHPPIWAVIGFIVPIVQLWFPYECVADTLPAGHPGRRTVGWWWAFYLTQGLGALPVGITAAFSVPAGLAVAIVVSVLPVLTARNGVRMIAAIGQAHREIAGY
jgi:Domain of unknown function (DUF4328)/Protein of unknown function (DUF2510)